MKIAFVIIPRSPILFLSAQLDLLSHWQKPFIANNHIIDSLRYNIEVLWELILEFKSKNQRHPCHFHFQTSQISITCFRTQTQCIVRTCISYSPLAQSIKNQSLPSLSRIFRISARKNKSRHCICHLVQFNSHTINILSFRAQVHLPIRLFAFFRSHFQPPTLKVAKYRNNFFCHIPKLGRLLFPAVSPRYTFLTSSQNIFAILLSLALNKSRFIVGLNYRLHSTNIMPRNLPLLLYELAVCSNWQLITEKLLRADECQKQKKMNNHQFQIQIQLPSPQIQEDRNINLFKYSKVKTNIFAISIEKLCNF